MVIRAIRTPYRGVTFASTLEADWAKTLDSLRIAWQYEPEGVKLPDGQNYRCDFYLPHLRTWLEVKGPHNQRIDKPAVLARAVEHADGCASGRPLASSGLPGRGCACGFGPDYPYDLVVVGRPATSGRLTFESPHGIDAHLVVMRCRVCSQHCFLSSTGLLVCRRCRREATGSQAWPSGSHPFQRVEPPRGRARRRSA